MAKDEQDSTKNAGVDAAPGEPELTPGVRREPSAPAPRAGRGRWTRGAPFLQLLAYYVVLVALVMGLVALAPPLRQALFAPVVLPAVTGEQGLFTDAPGAALPVPGGQSAPSFAVDRALTTLLSIVGALLLVLPVAGVYMRTKHLRFDPALVRSVIILPIVVAGIALVVKNSIALAFSLAGIVAAVRFRNTLKDPRDAVYIFLVIGIGLSAGVQALDVALVMSMIFNFVVLLLWRFNVGSVYGRSFARTGVISVGDAALMLAQAPAGRRELRRALLTEADRLDAEGVLLVHATDPEPIRAVVQDVMAEMAKDWKLARVAPRGADHTTLEYLVKLKKKTSSAELVATLEERSGYRLGAAEYFSLRVREHKRKDRSQEDAE